MIDLAGPYPDLPFIAIAFLLGSIPVGYLIGKAKGIDVRSQGSGNTGATNLLRTAGKKAGALTLLGDIAKGLIAVLLANLAPHICSQAHPLPAVLGFSAICGHCFSPFLQFKGGKGVATALGAFLAFAPLPTLLALLVFVVVFMLTRYVSLSSISAVLSMPVILLFLFPSQAENGALPAALATAALIVYRHKTNIQRLLKGEESRFAKKPE